MHKVWKSYLRFCLSGLENVFLFFVSQVFVVVETIQVVVKLHLIPFQRVDLPQIGKTRVEFAKIDFASTDILIDGLNLYI